MASTFTTGFGIEKIGSGEQDGAWGTTTNHNLDILDRIASYKTIAITANADTATLTVREASPGAGTENLQDGMYRVIKFTGTLDSACTITIAPNDSPAWFIIENATSGSQSLILSQGSGANVTVQNGKNVIIYCDGAGGGAAVVNALSDLQIATLEVTGAAAIDGALTAAAITGTTLTTSGIVSVDDTTTSTSGTTGSIHTDGGLGVAGTAFVAGAATVGGASQFNSTVTVGVNDTGYDVQFFGATSGAHMLWDESADDLKLVGAAGLTVAGDIDVDGTTNLDAVDIDGAVQIDGAVTVGVNDTGYDVKFFGATSGAHMLWDESADDLKLVGAAGLTVAGNIDVDGTTNLDAVDIDGAVQIDATLSVGVDDTGYDVKFFGDTASAYMLWDTSADDLILGGAARLGVGNAPAADMVLDVNGQIKSGSTGAALDTTPGGFGTFIQTTSSGQCAIMSYSSGGGATLSLHSNAGGAAVVENIRMTPTVVTVNESSLDMDFRVESNGNANMLFVDGGNDRVGVGTATPLRQLHLDSAGSTVQLITAPAGYSANIFFGTTSDDNSGRIVYTIDDEAMAFWTNDASRMTINNAGLVQITGAVQITGNANALFGMQTTGDTASQVMGTKYLNNSGATTAQTFATGDSSSGSVFRIKGIGSVELIGGDIGVTGAAADLKVAATGEVTMPNQPAFLVSANARIADVTGDGTAYTAVWNTEVFDQGGNFASNSFTAPVTGKYQFNVNISLLGIVSGHTTCIITLVTSNRSIRTHFKSQVFAQTGSGDQNSFNGSVLTDMDASDTAHVTITVNGGSKVVDFDGDANYASAFSGSLIA